MKHGTPTGARDHYRRGEKPCEKCRKAANERRNNPVPRTLQGHGTAGAYRRHQRHEEKPCQECLDWYNAQRKIRRANPKEEEYDEIIWVKKRGIWRKK